MRSRKSAKNRNAKSKMPCIAKEMKKFQLTSVNNKKNGTRNINEKKNVKLDASGNTRNNDNGRNNHVKNGSDKKRNAQPQYVNG